MTAGSRRTSRGAAAASLFALVVLARSFAAAETFVGPGATGAAFLKIPISARATGLAGAFTGVSGDVAALEYNPAGLTGVRRTDINATYISHLVDTSLQSVSIAFPVTFRGDSRRSSDDDLPYNKHLIAAVHYRLFQADDDARNNLGVKLKEFDVRDQLIQAGIAYAPVRWLTGGFAVKSISSKLEDESASTFAADVGVLGRMSDVWTWGASLMNAGPAHKFDREGDPLPSLARVGTSYRIKALRLVADASAGRDKIVVPAGGAELALNPYVNLRVGALFHTTFEYAAGIGIQSNLAAAGVRRLDPRVDARQTLDATPEPPRDPWDFSNNPAKKLEPKLDVGLDYALRSNNDLGFTHTVTLRLLY